MTRNDPQTPAGQIDDLADKLIQHGFVPNAFLLSINGTLDVPDDMELPAPWNLPSRLFQFPVEITDDCRHLQLRHPLLAEHPFVQGIESALGFKLDPDDCTQASTPTWWHAVDLITSGHWRELLATAEFTTPDDIAGAVAYGLRYSAHDKASNGRINTIEAREIMKALDSAEPKGRVETLLSFSQPLPCKRDSGRVAWPINSGMDRDAITEAWGFILAIEAGWFAYDRSGYLNWSEAGRGRYDAGNSATLIEPSGQSAFAF